MRSRERRGRRGEGRESGEKEGTGGNGRANRIDKRAWSVRGEGRGERRGREGRKDGVSFVYIHANEVWETYLGT